jgi:hypothetical protein
MGWRFIESGSLSSDLAESSSLRYLTLGLMAAQWNGVMVLLPMGFLPTDWILCT